MEYPHFIFNILHTVLLVTVRLIQAAEQTTFNLRLFVTILICDVWELISFTTEIPEMEQQIKSPEPHKDINCSQYI
jgi:LytS/YehU family sensor histidine kinase